MVLYLLKRGVTWKETVTVSLAFALYYIGFSMLGAVRNIPLDWLDGIAVFLFLAGSVINTLAELLRDQWKKDEQHKGKLYTGGLFKYAVHINYFGDVVWVIGFALLTRNLWSGIIPIFLIIMFVFFNIPEHDRYLRDKYGEAFKEYEKKTKKLIPFIY
ncbi:isoprenylcysteine carboxylmethyltransferase family protein [Virgibacillus sp. NKC19-3]|nr:isoprenylcysteine carboxylmethyltransferase family protein [Virgibacillus sp. NKC19-3]